VVQHVYPRTVVLHYKNPTKRVDILVVQSEHHHLERSLISCFKKKTFVLTRAVHVLSHIY